MSLFKKFYTTYKYLLLNFLLFLIYLQRNKALVSVYIYSLLIIDYSNYR